MINAFKRSAFTRALTQAITRSYQVPTPEYGSLEEEPGIIAKRIIQCVGDRVRKVDPSRWESIPITWKTNFYDDAGRIDMRLAIEIHDAIEREFGIDVNDKKILVGSIEDAYFVVTESHSAL